MIAMETQEKDEIEKRAVKKKVTKNPARQRKIKEVVSESLSDKEIKPKQLSSFKSI